MARLFVVLALLSLSGFFDLGYGGVSALFSDKYKVYIVYMGSTGGVEPEKLTASHLQLLHETLESPNGADGSLLYSYKHGFNGFSALLTDDHAKTLAAKAGVVAVFPSQTTQLLTINSWDFLGLTKERAVEIGQHGGSVIIGVLDSGVWPMLPSFDDCQMGPIPTRWKGACDGGVDFERSHCNRKLIGVRYHSRGFTASIKKNSTTTPELLNLSALDWIGHGTHVATTAGGSVAEDAHFGAGLMKGAARGGNPMARIAIYKVCWEHGGTDMCNDADVLAGYDFAIQDGVDILSASFGSARPAETDANFIGSFHAMRNGILTVCAAGNSGPGPNTITNTAPWVITVAASTFSRDVATLIRLGDNQIFMGSSFFLPSGSLRPFQELVYGGDIPAPLYYNTQSRLCLLNSLDAEKVRGKIVLCRQEPHGPDEPSIAEKRSYLQRIGAAGMIITNDNDLPSPFFDNFPFSVVPSSVGLSICRYIHSNRKPIAAISDPAIVWNASPAPAIAGFSSRGPNPLTSNILKPDIIASGVSILAGYSPLHFPHIQYNIMSGTSMATPHVSGAAALVKARHSCSWSPAFIKSALMTTATNVNNQGQPIATNTGASANPFDYGSGFLNPLAALDPGLIYDTKVEDYVKYLCYTGLDQAKISAIVGPDMNVSCPTVVTPELISQINLPSIAISELHGQAVIERTVTNVGAHNSTYISKVVFSPEVAVSVLPVELKFSAFVHFITYKVSFRVLSPWRDRNLFGSITWTNGQHSVYSPIAINSVFSSLREEPSLLDTSSSSSGDAQQCHSIGADDVIVGCQSRFNSEHGQSTPEMLWPTV